MRPSAHHDGTDPPRLTFDARLEKRKTGRRVAAGLFRSLCNHSVKTSSPGRFCGISRTAVDRHDVVGIADAAQGRCASALRSAGHSCGGAALDDMSVRAGASLRSTRDCARLEHALPLPHVLHLRALSLLPFASRCSGTMSPAPLWCSDVTVDEFHRACWAGQPCAPCAALELFMALLGARVSVRER